MVLGALADGVNHWTGGLDDFYMWRFLISSGQVSALYTSGSERLHALLLLHAVPRAD